MSNHQKRLSVPNSWPVERKTETFTVAAGAGPHGDEGVPLLVVLRDVLGYADSKKEARYALRQGSVRINGDQATDEHRPVGMFDILAFAEREEYYRVFPDEGGRLALTPIEADAAGSKLGKVVGKRQVDGGDTQLTLHDGETLLVEDDYAVNDSIVVANEGSEIVAHFPYDEGALVTAVQGAHAGEIGRIEAIQVTPGSSSNNVVVSQDDDESGTAEPSRNEGGEAAAGFETVEKYVVVIDENFVEGDEGEETEDAEADEAEAAEAETETEADDADSEDGGDDE
jgi:small subunit ribosomal protein S4e